jgi:hypothetical protein
MDVLQRVILSVTEISEQKDKKISELEEKLKHLKMKTRS